MECCYALVVASHWSSNVQPGRDGRCTTGLAQWWTSPQSMFRTHKSHTENNATETLRRRPVVCHEHDHRGESVHSRNRHVHALLRHAQAYLEVAQDTAIGYEQAVSMGRLIAEIAAYLEAPSE
jgi:hypothetical protein